MLSEDSVFTTFTLLTSFHYTVVEFNSLQFTNCFSHLGRSNIINTNTNIRYPSRRRTHNRLVPSHKNRIRPTPTGRRDVWRARLGRNGCEWGAYGEAS